VFHVLLLNNIIWFLPYTMIWSFSFARISVIISIEFRIFMYRHAVRRFVFENHGLMKRMYGEQRHISVLRADMDTNDIEGGVWNRRREESSLNRYDSQPPPPAPTSGTSAGTASTSNSTSTTTSTTTTTSTARPFNVTTASVADIIPPTTTAVAEDVEDGTSDDVTVDDQMQFETTTDPIASTQRTDQVQEQPEFFQESTNGGTDNTQKSKGMWVPIYIYMIKIKFDYYDTKSIRGDFNIIYYTKQVISTYFIGIDLIH